MARPARIALTIAALGWPVYPTLAAGTTPPAEAPPAEAPAASKPKVAVFPLAGGTLEELRDKVGLALRKKLDRDGAYEVIDGYTMKDLTAPAGGPVGADATPEAVRNWPPARAAGARPSSSGAS